MPIQPCNCAATATSCGAAGISPAVCPICHGRRTERGGADIRRDGARCNPQSLGERSREAPQQTGRPQTERSSSEDHCLDEGGREGPQQTGGSCRTSSRRKPAAGTLNRLSRCSKALAQPTGGPAVMEEACRYSERPLAFL